MDKYRAEGRYWVKYQGCWYIATWYWKGYVKGWWDVPEFTYSIGNYDHDFEIINERLIPLPKD